MNSLQSWDTRRNQEFAAFLKWFPYETSSFTVFTFYLLILSAQVMMTVSASGQTAVGFREISRWQGSQMDEPSSVQVLGGFAYVASGTAGLQIVDVSEPASPKLAGSFRSNDSASLGVCVVGSLAYLADGSAGLRILDVSQPEAPVQIALHTNWLGTNSAHAFNVRVEGGFAFVAAGQAGLQVVDVRNPRKPVGARREAAA